MVIEDEAASVCAAGAVGDTNGIYFDRDGNPVDNEINQRTIAISLPLLQKTKTVILSAGQPKLAATQEVLRSRVIKSLIGDGDGARVKRDHLLLSIRRGQQKIYHRIYPAFKKHAVLAKQFCCSICVGHSTANNERPNSPLGGDRFRGGI